MVNSKKKTKKKKKRWVVLTCLGHIWTTPTVGLLFFKPNGWFKRFTFF